MATIDTLILGAYAVNCYLLWGDNHHVLIVDPGSKNVKIKNLIESRGGIVDGIFLTHGHFDHIGGVDALVDYFKCPLYMSDLDIPLLKNPYLNVSSGGQEVLVQTQAIGLMPGQNTIGTFTFELLDAPGHTEGSCLMLWEGNMICGDVIFEGSIGRTDLVTGSNSKMFQTLQMVRSLDPNLVIYPGHGNKTTLQNEIQNNPFLL